MNSTNFCSIFFSCDTNQMNQLDLERNINYFKPNNSIKIEFKNLINYCLYCESSNEPL